MVPERRRRLCDCHKALWKFGRCYNRLREGARFEADQISETEAAEGRVGFHPFVEDVATGGLVGQGPEGP